MTLRYYERKIGDKIFHYARTCDTKEEANQAADLLRKRGYKARVFPVTFLMSSGFQVYVYPEEKIAHVTKTRRPRNSYSERG